MVIRKSFARARPTRSGRLEIVLIFFHTSVAAQKVSPIKLGFTQSPSLFVGNLLFVAADALPATPNAAAIPTATRATRAFFPVTMASLLAAIGHGYIDLNQARRRSVMSALGRKQTFAPQKVMSALPPNADILRAPAERQACWPHRF